MRRSTAEIIRQHGPFPGVDHVHGVTYDGQNVWFAAGDKLIAYDPASGKTLRSIDVAADAGTAFDGQHLYQLAGDRIQKIDPKTGRVLSTIRRPAAAVTRGSRGPKGRSGWGNIATGRFIKSIPKQGRFFAPSSPTVSSPASPGSTASFGTAPGKVTRAI
jgi:glutamine cyclotransferase